MANTEEKKAKKPPFLKGVKSEDQLAGEKLPDQTDGGSGRDHNDPVRADRVT